MVVFLLALMAVSVSLGALTWLFIMAVRGSARASVKEWHTDMTPDGKEVRP